MTRLRRTSPLRICQLLQSPGRYCLARLRRSRPLKRMVSAMAALRSAFPGLQVGGL
ncbi:hypothetical protein ABN584_11535 [Gloeocapsa sp. BRSZ]